MRRRARTATWLLRRFALGQARNQPGRTAVQVAAIAIGVALGFAVHLINTSALDEFSAAERTLSGAADVSVVGSAAGFDEALYERIATDPSVSMAAPALEIEASVAEDRARPGAGTPVRGTALRIVGIDVLRSGLISPDLVGQPGQPGGVADSRSNGGPQRDGLLPLLSGGLFVAPAALGKLHRSVGDDLPVVVGDHTVLLPIAGILPSANGAIAAMDLGYAQWRFNRLGRLTRIDIKFAAATTAAQVAATEQAWNLPPDVHLEQPQVAVERDQGLSRAYRVNLNVLSMVALFTGSFLIFSLQSQAIVARRAQLALLRMLGATRGAVTRMLIAEGLVLGAIGALLGLAGGAALAAAALRTLGGDLGGGYFPAAAPHLVIAPRAALTFFVLGLVAAMAGSWLPAAEAGAQAPAPALKAGVDPAPGSQRPHRWTVLAGLALGAALLALPPVGGIALGAYAAIAVLLLTTIALKPLVAPALFGALARAVARSRWLARYAAAWLAATRLARLPRFAAVGAAGIVASFALMVAMATMVSSFRSSFDIWLSQVLAADLYVRASAAGTTARFAAADLARLQADPDVTHAQFSNVQTALLDPTHHPERAPIAIIARPMDAAAHGIVRLPLLGPELAVAAPAIPVWVSEAMVDLYGARPGTRLELPLAGRLVAVTVAGVWRDYARQGGSVVIDIGDYERLSGDASRTDAALWLRPGADTNAVALRLFDALVTPAAQIIQPGQIRALSLRLFDRSFQVTYLLEWSAILIGLLGLGTTFSAQAIARTREFGMLRHLGVTRRQVLALLAAEATLVTALAAALGLAAGLAIAWILVDVVNPQSFHWSMELRIPVPLVAGLSIALLLAAALTSVVAGRRALSIDAVRAVKDDW